MQLEIQECHGIDIGPTEGFLCHAGVQETKHHRFDWRTHQELESGSKLANALSLRCPPVPHTRLVQVAPQWKRCCGCRMTSVCMAPHKFAMRFVKSPWQFLSLYFKGGLLHEIWHRENIPINAKPYRRTCTHLCLVLFCKNIA